MVVSTSCSVKTGGMWAVTAVTGVPQREFVGGNLREREREST